MSAKTRRPAVEGWLRLDADDPRLLGSRCRACGTVFFPKEETFCRNPACAGSDFDEAPLSRRGTLWSYTTGNYAPPAPYVASDPFEPYTIAAVELADEKIVILGQVADGIGVENLSVGMEMELVLDTLFEDDDAEHVVWKWRPAA